MPDIDARLVELGITLPSPPRPIAAYVPAVTVDHFGGVGGGRLVFVSGQLPGTAPGVLLSTGTVPSEATPEKATEAARRCIINALAVLKAEVGDLARVRRIVKLDVFVASDHAFGGQPAIANGASELLVEVFGESGKHARAAVGAPALPLNATVEVAMTVLVD